MNFTFNTLRAANLLRLPTFKNAHGKAAHAASDGSDWSNSEWSNALAGEVGELAEAYLLLAIVRASGNVANLAKKHLRGDISGFELTAKVRGELADVVTYSDLLAYRCGIDLGEAVFEKFNTVSMRVGSTVFIDVSAEPNKEPRAFARNVGPAL